METNKARFCLFIIAIILLCVSTFAGEKDTLILDEWATVKGIVGTAEVRSSPSGEWRPVHVGMRIKMAWDVRTLIESSLELAFESGNVIKLSENSEVSLATLFNAEDAMQSDSPVKVVSETDSLIVITITDKARK